jgi:predicted nucleotidyltransferase
MSVLDSKDYNFLRENEHLGDNIIILGYGGSISYGTNIATSDTDIRGIATNSADEILLGMDFEQVVDVNTDTTIYSFNKIVNLLCSANPNTIEILGLRPDHYLKITEIGQMLLDNRELFLSKLVVNSFGGYAHSQLRRLDNKSARALNQTEHENHVLNSIMNAKYSFADRYSNYNDDIFDLYIDKATDENMESEIYADIHLTHYPLRDYLGMWNEMKTVIRDYDKVSKRNKNAIEHNKLTKHAMHLVRLYMMCIDILDKHEIVTYRENEHDLLMSIRNNKDFEWIDENHQPTEKFNKLVDDYQRKMEESAKRTTLPDKPDYNKINELKKAVNKKIIENEG